MLEPGSVIDGKLRIERIIGQGGMGIVAVATHLELDQKVALKVVHDAIAENHEVVERFIREARASAKLKSEHACKVTDVGRLESGAPYLVMELLDGFDLGGVIEQAHLPEVVAAEYVLQACVAIAEAHALGIIHRDLKPKNLFVTKRLDDTPLIKVLDFGIAKAPTAEDTQLTKTQTVIGSPGYMSPEQLRSAKDVDARSDIWSLGIILYECVSGKLPFPAETLMELAVQIAMDPPKPLPDTIYARYSAIVMRCLEKPADKRYPDVAALATDLANVIGPQAVPTRDLVHKLLSGRSPTSIGQSSWQNPASSKPITVASPGMVAATQYEDGAAPATTPVQVPPAPETASVAAAMPAVRETAHVEADAPPKSRKGVMAAIVAVVVLGLAGGAYALFFRGGGGGKEHKPAHHDAAVVAQANADAATVDAPPVVDAAVAVVPADAAAAHDASVVAAHADAAVIAAHADAAVVAHADAAVVVAHADAAVVAHPDAAVVAQIDAAVPVEDVRQQTETAKRELENGNYAAALAAAEKITRSHPRDGEAHRIATKAACESNNAAAARAHFSHVPGPKGPLRALCRKHNIDVSPDD